MEKYRLKQWYPSLGGDFDVRDIVYFDRIRGCYVSTYNSDIVLRKSEVENNPDFWELIEKKKPLFITEDGVEIFIGDTFIIIEDDFTKRKLTAHNLPYTEDFKRFKHESNADKYILWNKPLLSLNEIDDTIEMYTHEFEELIKLAKERIDNGK